VRNVIVTGASRGIGLATAETLAAAGYRVIGLARALTEEFASVARAAGQNATGAIEFRAFDLSETSGIPALIRGLHKDLGSFYGLVNNAGIGTAGPLGLMRDEDIEQLVRLNTLAPMILTKSVLRSMMVDGAGRIINIASVVALTGYKALSVYSATKASLIGFTRSLAREVGELGITVNAIAPGFLDTAMTKALGDAEREKVARRSALRRLIEPKDVAASVEFLLSEAARNITGTVLTVDAGNTA
jgi:3-oxoacyl-[acyl-carrier protein] reductase